MRRCGALAALLPEIDALFGVPQPVTHHPELDAGVHVLQAVDFSAAAGDLLPVRYAVLAHDLGKATTEPGGSPDDDDGSIQGLGDDDALEVRQALLPELATQLDRINPRPVPSSALPR